MTRPPPPVSRRTFLQRTLAAGAGLPTVSAALAACRAGPVPDDVAVPEAIERELRIYNWSDYIGETTVREFEREFGVRVVYDTFESNEELIARLQAGASGYDLICPSGYAVRVLRALDLLAPIDPRFLPNREHLDPGFTDQPFDPGDRYTVPWQWGTAGLAVRTDLVPDPPDSWGVFHDPAFRGRMTQLDDMRDVLGSWLKYRGRSYNSTDPGELAQARDDARRARPNLKSYVSAPVKGQLLAGDVWIAQLWNGDTAQAAQEHPAIRFVLPREGSMIYLDVMAMPRGAPHRRAAHEFLNYTLRPDVAAAIADRTGYGSPNRAGLALQRHPVLPPTALELERLEYQDDLGAATVLWDRMWTEVKAG